MRTNNKQPALFDVPHIDSIQDMLLKSVKTYSNKIALEDLTDYPTSNATYSELYDYIIKFGSSLQKLGIKPRDHIAIIGENRVQWAIAFLTGMMFDFVVIPVDKNLTHSEILNIINESDAMALIFSGTLYEVFKENKDVLGKVKSYINMDLDKKDNEFHSMTEMINTAPTVEQSLPKINPNEVSEIVYTSGSLGRAKGVMLTQKSVSSNLMAMRKMILTYPEDRFFSVLPLHHVYPCNCGFLCPLYSGASVHFARSLKTIPEDILKIKPTILLGAPLLYNKMYSKITKTISEKKMRSILVKALISISNFSQSLGLKNSKKVFFKKLHDNLGGSLRLLIAGGAAPDPKVSRGFRDFGFNILQGYGLTETSPILTLNRIEHFRDDSAGLPLPGVEVKINQPDKSGVGEIYSRGPNNMLGYYKNKEATEETFDGEWFKTGDLGYFDKEGLLYICGRKKNIIIANNGENVYPEEIEDMLNRQPFVFECMVYGEKDEKHDERIAALIVPDSPAFIEYSSKNNVQITKELIEKHIGEAVKETNKQLVQFKQIKKFYVQEKELEKTTTQKVKRNIVSNIVKYSISKD
jgi:long-chain acyl-CoA synthetase